MADLLSPVKHIFVVGTPGAGKTTFCQELEELLAHHNLGTRRIGDYPYLQSLFLKDMEQGIQWRFREDPESQFEVLDSRVYDEALKAIYDEKLSRADDSAESQISVIEFSRPTYDTSFYCYPVHVLNNSIIVHIAAPIALCNSRNEGRREALEKKLQGVLDRNSIFDADPDLHYVPRAVMGKYYAEDEEVDRRRTHCQQVTLSLLPFRRYFRLDNSLCEKDVFLEKSRGLIVREILPCVSSPEAFLEFYLRKLRRVQSLAIDSSSLLKSTNATAEVSRGNSGKKSTGTEQNGYDVFLAYSSADKLQAEAIGEVLKKRGLSTWLDDEQIPPGRPFQESIQQAIRRARAAAVFIGPTGLGRWEVFELRSLISACVERQIAVIPVLLPGVSDIPAELTFLSEFSWVSFESDVQEAVNLDRLEWGITAASRDRWTREGGAKSAGRGRQKRRRANI